MTRPCDNEPLTVASLPDDSVISEAVRLLKGFSDPTRFKLLLLLREGEVCVHQLVEVLNVSQSAVSHQLRLLREARLVTSQKEGRHVFYSLADDHVRQLLENTLSHSAETVPK